MYEAYMMRFEMLADQRARESHLTQNTTEEQAQTDEGWASVAGQAYAERPQPKPPSTSRKSQSPSNSIELPPGFRLRWFADFVYSKRTMERVFMPVLADLEIEYIEALAAARPNKARWVYWRGIMAFWATVAAHTWSKVGAAIQGVVKVFTGR